MDTNPDFAPTTALPLADRNPSVPATVRLPYSLVPGINIWSYAYQKALATLGKQKIPTGPKNHKKPLPRVIDQGLYLRSFLINNFLTSITFRRPF